MRGEVQLTKPMELCIELDCGVVVSRDFNSRICAPAYQAGLRPAIRGTTGAAGEEASLCADPAGEGRAAVQEQQSPGPSPWGLQGSGRFQHQGGENYLFVLNF